MKKVEDQESGISRENNGLPSINSSPNDTHRNYPKRLEETNVDP